jgi:ADP-heptose:LPS heptosyltransferase/GT2 family glycosyltransferase
MRILVSKPDALGDQVLATSFVQALGRRWPDARIVWHVREGMEVITQLVADSAIFRPNLGAPPASEAERLWTETSAPIVVVPYPIHPFTDWEPALNARFAWWCAFVAATTWDLAIAPTVNRTGLSDATVTASNAPQRVAFAANASCQPLIEAAFAPLPQKRADFTREIPSSLHESEWTQHARLLEAVAPGELLQPPVFQISSTAVAEAQALLGVAPRLALIAPGVGQHAQRAWPIEKFAQLASALSSRGLEVRWLEGPNDAGYFARLPAGASATRVRIDATRLDLLAAIVQQASLLVCNDTSYVHLGAALDTPTVAIFGAGQKARFIPAFGRVHVVQGDPVCGGCQWQCAWDHYVCVQEVPFDDVLQTVEAQLSAPQSAHRRLVLPLPLQPPAANSEEALERVRDWYQQELNRLRWDGWARLQIINDVLQRLAARDQRLAQLTDELDVARRMSGGIDASHNPSASVLPKLSIIIPMGRPERADGTLQSLIRQSLTPSAWEVVVVGVGASRLLSKYPQLPLVPVDLERNLLPPRTRVEGVKRASGEWFLFVDDDVQLAPDFFEMLARILAVPPAVEASGQLPLGAIGVRLPGGRGTYFEHLTDISNFWSQQSPIRAVPHTVWFLYSAAIVVRAEAYHRSGGFNPDLPNGEDVDLTQRIKAAGYVLAYEPSLVAYHFHGRDSLWRMWRYFWRNGNAAQYFFAGFGGVCCYSLRTVLTRAWGDIHMNRNFQKTQGVRLGLRLPWIALNYLVVESSLEWHWQEYLWKSKRFRQFPARTPSDQNAAKAFAAWEDGRTLIGLARYTLALVQNLTDPVRR